MAQDRIADTTADGIARPPDRRIDFDLEAFRWAGIEEQAYKFTLGDERGMGWKGVTRHTLASPAALPAAFELRYFELQPGGYSSLEKHRHVHFVIAVRGSGRALIDEDVLDVSPFDALYVASLTPHRWLNEGDQPFGFLCTVDGKRDQPVPLDDAEWERLRSNRVTAPYVF